MFTRVSFFLSLFTIRVREYCVVFVSCALTRNTRIIASSTGRMSDNCSIFVFRLIFLTSLTFLRPLQLMSLHNVAALALRTRGGHVGARGKNYTR